MVTRPNILCVVGEDTTPYFGSYGDEVARTPNLDRLAQAGTRYENCFSVAPVCAPSRFAMITGMYPTTCGPAHQMRASGRMPDWLHGFPTLLRRAGYYCTNNPKTDYNAPIDLDETWDECGETAHWRHRPDGSPFFAVFNYNVTHESSLFPGVRDSVQRVTDPDSVRLPTYHPDTPTMREDRARFYDMVAELDRLVGQCLDELAADGLADDTIVLHYSDHGCGLPGYKRYAFDTGLRVPLIVYTPPRWSELAPGPAGTVIDTPVSGVDIPPTVLGLAGVDVPDYMQGVPFAGRARSRRRYAYSGRDRMDERYDMQRTVRDVRYRYVRNYAPHVPYGQHNAYMWRQAGVREWQERYRDGKLAPVQRRFWEQKPAEQLHDLHTDPDEVDNLVDSPDHRDILARLRKALDDHLVATRDNGFIPEGSPVEGYEQSRDDAAFPVAAVMELAGVAIQRSADNLPRLVDQLRSDNEIIRYWAARGLVMLGEASSEAAADLRASLRDPSPHVVIAAAEALARTGEADQPLRVLAGLLTDHPDPRVRLQAANALDSLGQRARPVRAAVDQAARDGDDYVVWAATWIAEVLAG